uniref:Uncharacterized protein n=1 Tax=Glossina brevipalpis TaxID=37001 RepID=A0A1A9W1F0_9MUSC
MTESLYYIYTYLSAFFTPDHIAAETGGIKRKLPTGGEAYGIPRYASTGSKWRPSNCTITPDKAPLRVWIMRDESCAAAVYAAALLMKTQLSVMLMISLLLKIIK